MNLRFLLLSAALAPMSIAGSALAPQQPPVPSVMGGGNVSAGVGEESSWTVGQIATMEKLRDAAMKDTYAYSELRHLTDNIGPRLAGSPQAQHAVEWVAAEMRSLGADVRLESATVPHWVRGAEMAEMVTWPDMTPGTTRKVVLTALGGSVATPAEGITAEVVVVDSFAALKALPAGSVKGKILLLNHKFDKELAAVGNGEMAYGEAVAYREGGPAAAEAVGAVAVLVRSVGGADYRIPHTGMTDYPAGQPKIPAAAVTAEDADTLKYLAGEGPVRLHITLTPQTLPDAPSFNVVADWKGSEHPEQVVIVSGHLDSWDLGTGAIDDGAGIVVAMQTVHLMQELGIHPKRTIRFVGWMAEEEGSQGEAAYAAAHKADFTSHIGAIEADLGADHPTGFDCGGKPALVQYLRPVANVLSAIGAPDFRSTGNAGSDLESLYEAGVPTFAPIQDSRFYFNYHHTAADTFDKVSLKHLNENAALMAVLAYALADANAPAPR